MNIADLIERSKSSERIDYTKISCQHADDPLVPVTDAARLRVTPIWTVEGDFEGKKYAEYRVDHPEYDQVYVRRPLLGMLFAASESLPGNLKLVVHAGHRPPEVQRRLLRECMHDYMRDHPEVSQDEALEHARMFVSDPDIKLPPHCCGAAVDVELFDTDANAYVDMGSPVNLDKDISHLHSDKVTEVQRANRMILLNAMLAAGFSSYYAEWWHFSYGDEIWAWFTHRSACLYDVVTV